MFNIIVVSTTHVYIKKNSIITLNVKLDFKELNKLNTMKQKNKNNVLIMSKRTYQSINKDKDKDKDKDKNILPFSDQIE